MAWNNVTCEKCGCEFRVQLYGKISKRDWMIDHCTWICDDCKEEEKNKKAEEAKKEASEMNLPDLEGSEKQIRWALTVRKEYLERLNAVFQDYKTPAAIQKNILDYICSQTFSKFFIDECRGTLSEYDVELLCKKYQANKEIIEVKEIEKDITLETTIHPENKTTETVAKIRQKDDKITINFFEKSDEFKIIVKAKKYRWNDGWTRKITKYCGKIEDRIAEIGNDILNAGFPVSIIDPEIREKAVSGEYEEEIDRWIMRYTGEKYNGYFSIRTDWCRKMYKESRKVIGSVYHNGVVLVSPENWEELKDFAEINDFSFSEGAKELMEYCSGIEKKIVLPKKKSVKTKSKDNKKEATGKIDGSLKDD